MTCNFSIFLRYNAAFLSNFAPGKKQTEILCFSARGKTLRQANRNVSDKYDTNLNKGIMQKQKILIHKLLLHNKWSNDNSQT